VKVAKGKEQVASLRKSNELHEKADAAALRIAELQRDRQKVALDRAESNMARLQLKAPIAGRWRTRRCTGKQLHGQGPGRRSTLSRTAAGEHLRSKEMLVRCAVGEPDGASLVQGTRATCTWMPTPN